MDMYDLNERVQIFLQLLTPLADDIAIGEPAGEIRIPPGTVVTLGTKEYIVLESFANGTSAVVMKDPLPERRFGNTSDWKESELRAWLNGEFLNELASEIGWGNIVPFKRNLISMDGLDDYGVCEDSVSLMTVDEYRVYHKTIGTHRCNNWWWLISPYSTPSNDYTRLVCCVGSVGTVGCVDCDRSDGVRPFLCLNSSILQS